MSHRPHSPQRSLFLAVAAVLSASSLAATKLDSLLQIALTQPSASAVPGNAFASVPGQPEAIKVTVRFQGDGPAAIRAVGGQIGSISGDVATVTIPLAQLTVLAALPEVVFVEAARPLRARVNAGVAATKADTLRTGTAPNFSGATGKGVIVGIVDDGMDFRHLDFRKPDGSTRFLALWDQRASGTAGSPPSGFSYGGECTAAMIDQAIQEGVASKACTQPSSGNHGSHVGGIAAGNGQATGNGKAAYRFVGMAPEADLISANSIAGGIGGDGNAVLDGINYIKAKAKAAGKPVVINLSLGSYYGARDGTSNYERALSKAGEAGVILVGAAGNESGDPIRATAPIKEGQTVTIGYRIGVDKAQTVEMWYPGKNKWSIKVEGPNGCATDLIAAGSPATGKDTACGRIAIANGEVNPLNDDRQVSITFGSSAAAPSQGSYKISVTADAGSGTISMIGADDGNNGVFTDNTDTVTAQILTDTASATEVIAVGAYVTKTQWDSLNGASSNTGHGPIGDLARFSSRGPRRDCSNLEKCPPIMKPEIAAPGAMIMSALGQDVKRDDLSVIEADGQHIAYNGTSMATPHVAGAVALLLQKNPTLTPNEVKKLLFRNVQLNTFTPQLPLYDVQTLLPQTPNFAWGYGILDVAKAFENTTSLGGDTAFSVSANTSGTAKNLTLSATLVPKSADVGKTVKVYLVVILPNGSLLISNGTGFQPLGATPFPVYQTVTASSRIEVPILPAPFDASGLIGTQVIVGYGSTEAEMLANTQYRVIHTIR